LEKDEVKSIALGATREMYYWFPFLEGRTTKLSFHVQAIEDMTAPFVARGMVNILSDNSEPEPEPDGDNDDGKRSVD
jgi:hypothetical protein